MATIRQIEANKRNAQSSNGPKTDEGKAITAKNALKHGLFAVDTILPGENAQEFGDFLGTLHIEMKPAGELECVLVGRIAGLLWRLKRIGRLEVGILMWARAEGDSLDAQFSKLLGRPDTPFIAKQGHAYMKTEDSLAKLSRYETSLERSLYKALHEFQRLQAARNGKHVPTPVVVDVEVTERPEATTNETQDPSER